MIKAILILTMVMLGSTYSSDSEAGSYIYCKTKKAIESIESALVEACESGELVNTETPDADAEPGEEGYLGWFFTIPEDQQCDLGLNLPDLDFGLDFGLGKINVCNVLKTVSENAVEQVNEEFERIESEIDDVESDINDELDIDLDDVYTDGWDS